MVKPMRALTLRQRRRRSALVAVSLVALIALVWVWVGSSSSRSKNSTTTTHPAVAHGAKAQSTFPGPDGVEASWVVAENAHKGTTAWQIPLSNTPNVIAGFADHDDATLGQTVTFYVTTPSPTYSVTAYRMGWYHGAGGRQIWASKTLVASSQPACGFTMGVNLVSCTNWAPSFHLKLTKAFVQGDYLFKLVASTGQEDYIPLTISNPSSHAAYLVINRTFTEEGWNFWGGYDFYQGLGVCAPTYPVCNRARIVSYDRPYNTGNGASDFFGNEYPLLAFAEEHGLDVTYATDTALDADPSLEANHKVLLSLGHDETWSTPERQGAEGAEAHGTNIVFFGAAAVLRHVRMEPSPLGPERLEVNYRDSSEDPLNGTGNPLDVTGNTFASPPTSWSEIPLTGEEYAGYLNGVANVPFVVTDATSWVFAGTGLEDGSALQGVIMSDFDHESQSAGSPANVEVLGHSPIPLADAYTNQGTWSGDTYSDMTYYTNPTSHAGVLDTGTVNWIDALSTCQPGTTSCPTAYVQAITGNILKLFGSGPAGLVQPSVPNWQTIAPADS
jgi:hypothetical protein